MLTERAYAYDSPLGRIVLYADQSALTGLYFADKKPFPPGVLAKRKHDPVPPVVDKARQELDRYFGRALLRFTVPVRYRGTPFQNRVWREVSRIPYGETLSYTQVAERIGLDRRYARAVGHVNGRNPISIVIPCHRVVAADGALAGYAGGVVRKQALLVLEGALPRLSSPSLRR